jgi:hypothetical protein
MDAPAMVEELTLMLMYLTSWTERPGDLRRCWKGYEFAVLDHLDEQGLISQSQRAKSAYLTPEGEARARQLLEQWGIADK